MAPSSDRTQGMPPALEKKKRINPSVYQRDWKDGTNIEPRRYQHPRVCIMDYIVQDGIKKSVMTTEIISFLLNQTTSRIQGREAAI